jgi:hypothetical protein
MLKEPLFKHLHDLLGSRKPDLAPPGMYPRRA